MNPKVPGKPDEPPAAAEGLAEVPARSLLFPVVGVGASAGGFEAFTQLLQHLPAHCGMAFVLVQHLDPNHASSLVELLAKSTRMPVHQVTDGTPVEVNQVYVIPPNTEMVIRQETLHLMPRTESRGQH